ncbi:Hypothetical predicted protein [Podarcis lilfordi]|uniref:Uncharacterized protein n=1 Tax=Podarcis lilfordi TaxID=74358 RepID=A0AA35K1K8_9SAUR|nr:Hypothetical predicted protein [Podarcis lilfordi]
MLSLRLVRVASVVAKGHLFCVPLSFTIPIFGATLPCCMKPAQSRKPLKWDVWCCIFVSSPCQRKRISK